MQGNEERIMRTTKLLKEACHVYHAVILYTERNQLVTGPFTSGFYEVDSNSLNSQKVSHAAKITASSTELLFCTESKRRHFLAPSTSRGWGR